MNVLPAGLKGRDPVPETASRIYCPFLHVLVLKMKSTQLVFSLGITPECTVAMPALCVCVLL